MKRDLFLTTITLLFCFIVSHEVKSENWTDVVTSQPDGYIVDLQGNVTINSAEGLAWLVSVVNGLNGQTPDSFDGKIIKLSSTIDLNEYYWDVAIGTEENPFKGTFDGGGYEIVNLTVRVEGEVADYHALFGYVNKGDIKNVGVVDCGITTNHPSSSLACYVNESNITNCYSSGNIYCYGNGSVAGLILEFTNSVMTNCYTWIEDLNTHNGICVGGLVGSLEYSEMRNCYSASHWISSGNYNSYVGTLSGYRYAAVLYNAHGWANGNHSSGYFDELTTAENCQQMLYSDEESRWYLLDYPYIAHFGEGETDDLLTAMNYGITDIDENGLRTWKWSHGNNQCVETYGLPVFDGTYNNNCLAPDDFSVTSKIDNGEIGVNLSWTNTCDAAEWEINYRDKLEGGDWISVITDTNQCAIMGLDLTEEGQIAVYEFKVRSLCEEGSQSKWSCTKAAVFNWAVDENESDQIKVYPNPASDVINIIGIDALMVKICNVQGQTLFNYNCNDETELTIDVGFLESGVYLMQIFLESGVVNKTFIKK